METFNLSRQSYIKPEFLETYNKPARNNIQEICIREIYQFGKLDCYKSICITDMELQHIFSLLSNNTLQNQKALEALNKLATIEGVSQATKFDAMKKKNMVMVDVDITNNIILTIQAKIKGMEKEFSEQKQRPALEIEVTKREIFLMYFVLDLAHMVDLYIKRSDITIDQEHDEKYKKQIQRIKLTDSARQKLSVFFNPNMPYEKTGQ